MKYIIRFLLVTLAAALMALNIKTFIYAAGLLPGGFTGVTILIQDIFVKFLGIKIPFSVFYWGLNSVPAAICFRYVGKKFTLYSLWMVIASGLFTDIIPGLNFTDDILLCAVFGGIFQGAAICLCLSAKATSGGTDFISIYVSEKTGRSAWNYIFAANCVVLVIFGFLFGWNRALYSIIFQYAATQIITMLYKRYQKTTFLIVTDKVDEVYKAINDTTHHDATIFTGKGCYQGAERKMLYTVVSSDEEAALVKALKITDQKAFVNILQSKDLRGNFFMKKND